MNRAVLPNRRQGEAFQFEIDGVAYRAMTTNFPDGRMAEMFLSGGKPGSSSDITARDGSIILSIALQCGTPLQTIYDAMSRLKNGEPAGPFGVAIKMAMEAKAQ